MKYNPEQTVYWLNFDDEIEAISYGDLVRQYADETTSPRGVEPRYFVEYNPNPEPEEGSWELWTWGVGGNHPRLINSYTSEEEANLELLEMFENHMHEQDQLVVWFAEAREQLVKEIEEVRKEREDE